MFHRLLPLRSLRQEGAFSELEACLRYRTNDSLHTSVSVSSWRWSSGFHSDSIAASSAADVDAAAASATTTNSPSASASASVPASASDTLSVGACVAAFRSRGHLLARLDPLNRGADGLSGRGVWLGEEQGASSSASANTNPCSRSRA